MTSASGLPETMTAIGLSGHGGPEVLVPEPRPVPAPGAGEVLIAVEAAGVNRPDALQRMGVYPPPPGAPDIPGLEVAGRVVAAGEGAESHVGRAVTALVPGGGYAQFCVAAAVCCLPVPARLSMQEAAGLPETAFTVWSNLVMRGRLAAGETLLVHGGTSGIGTTAIQIGKALGARVIATAGSADKCEAMTRLGADHAIDYRRQDFVAEVDAFTGGRGADLILDMVGGDYVERNWQAAAIEGRIVQIAFLRGAKVTAGFDLLMRKRLTHTGSTLRPRDNAFKGEVARQLREQVWPMIEAGRVTVVVDSTFPLEQAAEAHRRLDADHIGKVILTVG